MLSRFVRRFRTPLAMLAAAFYFTHRLWGSDHLPRGDTFQNLYFVLNENLLRGDFNPYHWYYTSFMPFSGLSNPILMGVSRLLSFFFTPEHALEHAFWTCFIVSALLVWVVSLSVYYWLKTFDFSEPVSAVGAIVASYTGFMMTGVYEFDHMYLMSFAAVPIVFHAFRRLCEGAMWLRWVSVAALAIGISLLGGSNAPLFYYLPILVMMPVFISGHRAKATLGIVVSGIGAFAIASLVLVPAIASLEETNRAALSFASGIPSLTIKEKIYTLFLRDWWKTGGTHLHESDYFLGIPIALLSFAGIMTVLKERKQKGFSLSAILLLCFFSALVISHHTWLPRGLGDALSWFFTRFSIRHPNRLFALALIPVAYFSAVALTRATPNWLFRAGCVVGGSFLVVLVRQISPRYDLIIPDARVAFLVSTVFAGLSVLILFVRRYLRAESRKNAANCVFAFTVYGMYAFAPTPLTHYLPEYFGDGGLTAKLPKDRLSWQSALGIKTFYSENLSRLKASLMTAPSHLLEPETKVGRILDDRDLSIGRHGFFAPQTGHHFFFTSLSDPASPRRLRELEISRDSVLDLAGICTRVHSNGGVVTMINQRSTCFEEAFLADKLVPASDKQTLEWVNTSPALDFKRQVHVPCTGDKCGAIKVIGELPEGRVSDLRYHEGTIELDTRSARPANVVVTVPYRKQWRARVNGLPANVYRADYAFLTVPVPAGGAHVELFLERSLEKNVFWVTIGSTLLFIAAFFSGFVSVSNPLKIVRGKLQWRPS